jgi:hypothetical protein
MTHPTHREAMQVYFAKRGIASRLQGRKLYVARRKGWNGCAAYVEFEDPNSTTWAERGVFCGCTLRVIPLGGQKNWDYCARIESELLAIVGVSDEWASAS